MTKLLNRAKMTTTTTGTGTITLGSASTGFQTFVAAGALNGDLFHYVIENGSTWEIGTGTYTTSGTTLSRTLISSSSGSLLNLAGTSTVFVSAIAEDLQAINLPSLAAEPATPADDTGVLYARTIAGRVMPKWVGPSGVDYPLQAHLGFNNITMWRGGNTTTATTFASVLGSLPYTGASPVAPTIPNLATTSLRNQTYRSTISTSATAGTIAYIRANALRFWRGNAAGLGGFFVTHRFALSGTLQAGMRCFVGIQNVVTNPTNVDPTTDTTVSRVGLALNTNTGNWNLIHNLAATAPTIIALGASFPVNNTDMMELSLFCKPNDTQIGYRVVNWSTNQQVSGSLTTNLPLNTAFMGPVQWITNNATAAAQTFDFISTYVETDY